MTLEMIVVSADQFHKTARHFASEKECFTGPWMAKEKIRTVEGETAREFLKRFPVQVISGNRMSDRHEVYTDLVGTSGDQP